VGVRAYCIPCEDAIRLAKPKKDYPPAKENLTCQRCLLTMTADVFSVDKTRKTGRKGWCKMCCGDYIAANKDRHKSLVRKNYLEHRDERLAKSKERYGPGGDREEYKRDYYVKNKDALLARHRAYWHTNANKMHAIQKRYRETYPDKVRIRLLSWVNRNKERYRSVHTAGTLRRRARLRGLPHERIIRKDIFIRDKSTCQVCGIILDPNKWHMDHYIPVALGGAHLHTNVRALCPSCNRKKGSKMPTDTWAPPT